MLRYTVLRILIFFGVLTLLWLLGLRSDQTRVVLVVAAALLSMGVSYVVLRPFREDYSRQIAEKVDARRSAREQRPTDEQVEDAALADSGGPAAEAARAETTAGEGAGSAGADAPAEDRDDFR